VPTHVFGVKRFVGRVRPVRRTAAEAERTRQAILATARASFAEHGFAAASTTSIATAAGVTRGALYHHFADKTELFRAVFVQLEHELNDTVVTAALAQTDSLKAFVAGCAAWLDFAVRSDYQRIATIDAPSVLGAVEWHEIDAGIGLASMEAGLAALARDGIVRKPPSRALAVLLFGALTDAGLALARGDGPSKDELLAEFLDLVTAPVAPKRASRRASQRPGAR
jgi:AcrR family transcriptional regulator